MKDHPAVREQVRLLWIANGGNLTKACNIANVPINRAEKWKERGNWTLSTPEANQFHLSENVGKTADNLSNEIAQNGRQTRVNLSRTHLRHSKGELSPKDAKLVAEAAKITHDWGNVQKHEILGLHVLTGKVQVERAESE